ncbi:MAG: T9SS type A sorting domain-containing protein [Saprospiraceae bacterium]|uniref:T9SS type A sorting domain-containing protein n=1 Tax=Candidatus Opimibacter skivensis TaxID=2982028 RepID=A0A9D7SW40_9BACT|nr:T9SS type A sorting domain-containing protein [Candidatus Opimibacter skivensis]
MRHTRILYLIVWMCSGLGQLLNAQITCGPEVAVDTNGFIGTAFFNYGSQSRAKSQNYRTSVAIGQTFVGFTESLSDNSTVGFYSRFLLPPFALKVSATQGDLLDRIQVSWEIDALGPSPNEGFNIYRDDVFLATVGANIRNYNDFNVIAGHPYIYSVRGLNTYGEGVTSDALGFQVPNGVVTGWVSTLSGNPVPDALVTLTPMQGFSAKFGATDGAMTMNENLLDPFLPDPGDDWTITFWIKTDQASNNASLIQMKPFPLYIRALTSSSGHEGVAVSETNMTTPFLSATFADSTKNDWHHVALSFDGSSHQGRLYIDGVLEGIAPMNTVMSADTINIGSLAGNGGWVGRLDELRIYHRKLDELDFSQVMEGTASSQTPFLSHYWKMDEELGLKSYDIVKRHKLYFCGAEFDADRPPVHTAGITNEDGYYRIESASYGTGTTFLAKPSKNFYMHRALKFKPNDGDYATIPNFSLTPKATIELWVNSNEPDGTQCLVSKRWGSNEFRIELIALGVGNHLFVTLNGEQTDFGTIASGYQHLAITLDSLTGIVAVFANGVNLDSHAYPGVIGNFSDTSEVWLLGAIEDGFGIHSEFFDGLIDEIAVYDTTLSLMAIQDHFENARDIQEKGLRVYFPLDEGNGIRLGNIGSAFLEGGTTYGTEWSAFAAHQVAEPHIFTPVTRQVTLNPSVTSVDQVDFTDRSSIPVSGFVRYKNTDCFAKNVEILINGSSFNPKIFSDSTGRFVIDFDPGTTAILSPKFENHVFVPASWSITNVTSPVAGIVFNDITTRKVTGQVAGGLCKKSIITAPPGTGQGTVCVVKVRTTDGCLERQITIDNQEGNFEFDNLPPVEKLTVAVVEHSNPVIKTAFQVQGGSTVNLTKKDTVINFIYTAMPQVEVVSGLDPYSPTCSMIVLDQFEHVAVGIKLKEQYIVTPNDDGVCYIDSANFRIFNGFGDEIIDTTMGNGLLLYEFRVGAPNPTPPYLKTLQIISSTLDGNDGEFTTQGLVTGIRAKDNTFTSIMPEIPTLILRDPPGDGSYSFLEKNQTICRSTSIVGATDIGGGGGLEVHLGGAQQIVAAPLGIGTIGEAGPIFDIGAEFQVTYQKTSENTFETCTTINSKISTSEDDLIVGGYQGGDIYMGDAINIVFGFADMISFNDTICQPNLHVIINVEPGDFATTFMYSEWYILSTVLPYLDSLANNTTADSAELVRYVESKNRWLAILANNAEQKKNARLIRNISFDAGVTYEYAESSDTTTTSSLEELTNSEEKLESHFGFEFNKAGFVGKLNFATATSNGGKNEDGKAVGVTTGYVLKDDDVLDAYSIDVGMDSVYKTPVFNIKAGQSSCPWEYGTAKREGVLLTSVDGPTRTDVPANEPAAYHFILGNTSATNETWTYAFTAGPESNPDGAKIFCNGAPMNQIQWYAIPFGTSLPVTVTVERGPVEYDYDNLEIVLYSACEDQRANDLGILPDTAENLYSAVYVSAHFIRPCSEVNINVPEQDWVLFPDPLTPGPDDERRITVSGYDTTETDFQLIRVQYRRSDGDGAWINLPGIHDRYNPMWSGYAALPDPKPPVLQPNFTQFFWETTGLSDGPYEIRAVSICSGDASDRPGYSQIIKGRIDREPPSLVGVPQPSDGVYQVGDEISFTFNQDVNCNKLIQADILDPNNVGLYDATTNTLIDADITCVDNKIVINPLFQNDLYENHILRAELHEIEDLTGNVLIQTDWEFYVDRNELAWLTDSVGVTKYADENKAITAKIHNRGGYPVPFSIQNVPDWVHVTPDAGTLVANEVRDIEFKVDSTLALGWYADSIILHTETGQNPFFMGGDELLPFGVRTICRPPDWKVDPSQYQLTMTLITRVSFNNAQSTDPEDIVAAFIDGEVRGVAKPIYVSSSNNYLAFVTIYGDNADIGKLVTYEIFDASACARYEGKFTDAAFNFSANGIQGSPTNSKLLSNGALIDDIPLKNGWNWISFNLHFPDSTINMALEQISNPVGDLIKDMTTFSVYNNNTWSGSLSTLTNTSAYMYLANQANSIRMTGTAITPASEPIPVVMGWNWIGYIPTYKLTVNEALASLSMDAEAGDIIKSQTAFAQFVNSTIGWVGDLKTMRSPKGYLLKMTNDGILTYPPASFTGEEQFYSRDAESLSTFWNVNASQFEHSMTLIGIFKYEETNATTADMELGAFVGDEIRGVGEPIYIDYLHAYMFFITCYANSSGEQLHFKLFDGATGEIQNLAEKMVYIPNDNKGSIESPVPFTLKTTGIGDVSGELSFNVQPNPFRDETVCRIELPAAQNVHLMITDMEGKNLYYTQIQANAGMNSFIWKGCTTIGTPLSNGVYFIRLETEQGVLTKKVMLQR